MRIDSKNSKSIAIIATLFFLAALPYLPYLLSYFEENSIAIYNFYYDHEGKRHFTPGFDNVVLYGPMINNMERMKFGDPLLEEYSDSLINLNFALSLLPFVLLSKALGIGLGAIIGGLIFNVLTILLIYNIIKCLFKTDLMRLLCTFIAYMCMHYRALDIAYFLRTFDFNFLFTHINNDSYLTRIPSLSFTFFYLLLSIYLIIKLNEIKTCNGRRILYTAIIGLNGMLYLYNFLIVLTLIGILFMIYLIKKNYKMIMQYFLAGLWCCFAFIIVYLPRTGIEKDSMLGVARFGLITIHSLSRENVIALLVLMICSYFYFFIVCKKIGKEEGTSPATVIYSVIIAIALQTNLNIITGFHVQHHHFLDYLLFFLILMSIYTFNEWINKTKAVQYGIYILAIALIVILTVNSFKPRDLKPIEPELKDLIEYINNNKIRDKTFLSLDKDEFYLIPIYTDNYIYISNIFSSQINVTNNIEQLSETLYLFKKDPSYMSQIFTMKDDEFFNYFHFGYLYYYFRPPCEDCLYDGKRVEQNWFGTGLGQVPDKDKEVYINILNKTHNLNDYKMDYLIVNNLKGQEIRWKENFVEIYKNNKYSLFYFSSEYKNQ